MANPVVAWLALGMATASLAWQIVSWVHSGPRVQVRIHKVRQDHQRTPFPAVYVIEIANSGRQLFDVQEVRLRLNPPKRSYLRHIVDAQWGKDTDSVRSASLPATLNPGGEIRVYARASRIDGEIDKGFDHWRLIPQARIGHRWVDGNWAGIRFPDSTETAQG